MTTPFTDNASPFTNKLPWAAPPTGLLDRITAQVAANPMQEPAPRPKVIWLSGLATAAAACLLLAWPGSLPATNHLMATQSASTMGVGATITSDELAMLPMDDFNMGTNTTESDLVETLVGF
jgi:hypothetical protein